MIEIKNTNKDILAKLMATENITVIHKKVPTAYFDVKSRTLCCPILKEDMSPQLTDLFMGHEVGHALNTPLEGWHSAVSERGMMFKGYLNVIEDVRIEKMIKSKYPGLRKSFYAGYKELANNDFFGIRGKDIHSMNFIDRINLFYKIGSVTKIEFTDEEMVYIDRANKLETFEQVMELAIELYEKQQQNTEEQLESMTDQEVQDLMEKLGIDEDEEEQQPGDSMSVETDDSNDEDSEQDGSDAKADTDDSEDSDEDSNSTDGSDGDTKDDEESEGDNEESDSGNSVTSNKSPQEQLQDELNKSISDESFREKEESLYDQDSFSRDPRYYELPKKIKYDNYIVDYTKINSKFEEKNYAGESFNREKIKPHVKEFQDSNKKIINYMVKEFEMKKAAASYNRSWSAKSGEIDMSKIHQYLLKDDIFNRVQITPEGKNHGVVMLLDWSGSMTGSVQSTVEQATLLSMFCRRLSIPFNLFAFSDSYGGSGYNSQINEIYEKMRKLNSDEDLVKRKLQQEIYDIESKRLFGTKEDSNINLGNLNLLEVYNNKMSNSEFNQAMENWFQLAQSIESNQRWGYEQDDSLATYDWNFNTPSGLNLGGTPLDHSLIVIRDYLKDFKTNYNLDICSLITLTDGASHNALSGNASIVDRKINRVFSIGDRYSKSTHKLLEWIQETVDVRTIGFYISDGKPTQVVWDAQSFCSTDVDSYGDAYDKHRKEFANLATSFTDGCYDLAILINQKKLKLNYNEDELVVEAGAQKGVLKRALVKAGNSKMKQRVILNKFVGQMAV